MGRLFWKIFIFILLAQMAGMVAVGATFWLRHRSLEQHHTGFPLHVYDEHGRPLPPPPHKPPGHFPVEPLIGTFYASLLAAALIAQYFSRPIRNLHDAFNQAANGKLEVRAGAMMGHRQDELADLGRDFDHMADRLKAAMDLQQNLLHDVSHELRSPLARLQVAVGLARQSPDKLQATMERIEMESGRINYLVEELLTLSRLDAGIMEMPRVDTELEELLSVIVDDARFEAKSKEQEVVLDCERDLMFKCQPELLLRALENVVRNALRHTPAGKRIHIVCRRQGAPSSIYISVLDQGPGVDPAELPHLFEPFFRGASHHADGHGLGLAIARRVIHAHCGEIMASNIAGDGLHVEITLPQS